MTLLLLAVVLGVSGCGGDGGGTPTPMEPEPNPLEPFVGSWDGEDVVHTQKSDTTVTFDLIENGGTLSLQIFSTDRYAVTVTFAGETTQESGGIRFDGTDIILSPESPAPQDDVRVSVTLMGDRMSWIGDSQFDFNFDDDPEETTLRVEFVRSGT